MKKVLSVVLTLCLFANVSFAAFDPYADEEVEKKSYKKNRRNTTRCDSYT